MKLLDNKTPQVEFDNIYAFILAEMSTNKAELVKVNGYSAIVSSDEAAKTFYIVHFEFVFYTLQEDVESNTNQLFSGNFFCNAIYTSHGRHKLHFYAGP